MFGGKFYFRFLWEPTGFKNLVTWNFLIKFHNQLPRLTHSWTKFWNSSTEHIPQPPIQPNHIPTLYIYIQWPRCHLLCPLPSTGFFKSMSTGVDSPPHIKLSMRAGSMTMTLCTIFLLADSLTLDWHPICNALPLSKLKNCLELEKTGQLTNLPNQTIREQIPCFPMTITLCG